MQEAAQDFRALETKGGTRVWDWEVRLHFCSEYSEGPDEAGSGSWVKGGNSLQQPFPKGRATINDADRK